MKLFRVLFSFDVLGLLVLGYFFADGLRYAPAPDYFGTWAPILAIPGLVLAGAWALRSTGKVRTANWLLGLLAAPFVLYLLFIGMFVLLQPDFK